MKELPPIFCFYAGCVFAALQAEKEKSKLKLRQVCVCVCGALGLGARAVCAHFELLAGAKQMDHVTLTCVTVNLLQPASLAVNC